MPQLTTPTTPEQLAKARAAWTGRLIRVMSNDYQYGTNNVGIVLRVKPADDRSYPWRGYFLIAFARRDGTTGRIWVQPHEYRKGANQDYAVEVYRATDQ